MPEAAISPLPGDPEHPFATVVTLVVATRAMSCDLHHIR